MPFTVPGVTAEHDYARQVLAGQAPPHSPIDVTLPTGGYYWQWAYRRTLADADGHYGLDTSDVYLPPGLPGYVVVTDDAGNTTQRNFTIRGRLMYLPLLARNR